MFETLTAALTDGQYWSLAIMGAFVVACICAAIGCAAEKIMGERA